MISDITVHRMNNGYNWFVHFNLAYRIQAHVLVCYTYQEQIQISIFFLFFLQKSGSLLKDKHIKYDFLILFSKVT